MSHELNLAITLPGQPLLIAAPALAIIALLAIVLIRKSRQKKVRLNSWADAADELGIQFVPNGSDLGPVVRGRVNDHVVSIAPAHRGRKKRVVTLYSVKFEAPEAPKFNLVKRLDPSGPIVDTGNPKFDAVVTVQTDQPDVLSRYLSGPRRAAILRLLTYWPSAQITNREAHLLTVGVEHEQDKLVDSICHLVAAAETFDRPDMTVTEPGPSTQTAAPSTVPETASDDHVADASVVTTADPVEREEQINGESDLLTEVRLDEATVLHDLFNTGLDTAGIAARFEQVYRGREVNWTGEVLRVGATEHGMQRIATFVGSADGENPESGRVVALTAVKPEPALNEGDVVSFSGALVNLDASQRLFHVV